MIIKNLMNLLRGILFGKQFCYIYPNVTIGKNVTIFPGAVIGREPKSSGATKRKIKSSDLGNTVISDNCVIGSNCVIYKGVKIGSNTMICDTACIREKVIIGSNSLIAMGVTINVDALIGNNVKIMDNCHITGNAIIEDNVFIGMLTTTANDNTMGKNNKEVENQKGPLIKTGARIGQGCCLLPDVIIGEDSLVGSNSVVTTHVEPKTIVYGSPAKKRN